MLQQMDPTQNTQQFQSMVRGMAGQPNGMNMPNDLKKAALNNRTL